jgi:DNA-binding NarL/FixJ family response regulator
MVIATCTSTEAALQMVSADDYSVIISDMGRPPDPRAGYTLLDALRKKGYKTAFIIYAGSSSEEAVRETREHGGYGTTNRPDVLISLVTSAILEQR